VDEATKKIGAFPTRLNSWEPSFKTHISIIWTALNKRQGFQSF